MRNGHPLFVAAKTGDVRAAKKLVEDLLCSDETERLKVFLAGRKPNLLAVTADEAMGFNAIPDALAQALGARLELTATAGTVVQANKVGHTRADGWHRLVTPAVFKGEVAAGDDYVLCDDHVGFGGTLANLRGFIEAHGGRVVGMTTLTETPGARQIAVRETTLNLLQDKHGRKLEEFWCGAIGHGTASLTNIEAGYLYRVESVAAIKARMAQAAELARRGGLSPVGL
jgi:adenine/guanine phosphoribosyltransferase-like PRPP-binding protein